MSVITPTPGCMPYFYLSHEMKISKRFFSFRDDFLCGCVWLLGQGCGLKKRENLHRIVFVRLFSAWFAGYGGVLACLGVVFGVNYAHRCDSNSL